MQNILEEILEVKKEEVKILHRDYSLSRFNDSEFYSRERLSLYESVKDDKNISIIAEIKKASPSKGIIREDFNHLQIADIYLNNEVNAISILTDINFFQGNINYLRDIAKIKSAPLLRKDFIIDEYQVIEAKSNGADAILLISEALSASQINELSHAAFETDLEVLLELHSGEQLSKIDFSLNKIIGINNRDLTTFYVDLKTTLSIAENIPDDIALISESGISRQDDLERLKDSPVDGILVGEHLMKSPNITDSIKQLKEWCYREN